MKPGERRQFSFEAGKRVTYHCNVAVQFDVELLSGTKVEGLIPAGGTLTIRMCDVPKAINLAMTEIQPEAVFNQKMSALEQVLAIMLKHMQRAAIVDFFTFNAELIALAEKLPEGPEKTVLQQLAGSYSEKDERPALRVIDGGREQERD